MPSPTGSAGAPASASAPTLGAAARPRIAALRCYAAAAASGPLIAAAFVAPAFYPLTWVSFVPLFWALRRTATDREAVIAAFAAGFLTNFIGFCWLVHTMHVFGGFPLPIAVFFYMCLTAGTALQFVLLGLGVRRMGFGLLGLAPALLWTTLEFLFPKLFPWRIANTQAPILLLLQSGDLAGPYLLSVAIVWVNAAAVLALERRRRPVPLAGALLLVGALAGYGAVRQPQIESAMRTAPSFRVALVQGNVSIKHKRNSAYFEVNVERYRQLSAAVQDQVDLLIWPETVAQWWTPANAKELEPRNHPFPDLRTYLIYGGLAYRYAADPEPETFNSAFLMGPEGFILGRYDKHILMPFGEYLPGARLVPWIRNLSPHTGDYTPGRSIEIFAVPGMKLGPLICYEDVVTDIPQAMTRAGAEVLLNILNDAWFGDTAGPHEHQALALWRAVENRRYLLRASNSGVTSIIDPLGRVSGELGTFREGVLTGEVQPLSVTTLYTRVGDVFAWVVALVTLALLALSRPRGRTGSPAATEPRQPGQLTPLALQGDSGVTPAGRVRATGPRGACTKGSPCREGIAAARAARESGGG